MKVKEIMKRQGELAEKIAKGEATDKDYEELKRLNQMIADAQEKASEPVDKASHETDLFVLDEEKFKAYCEEAQKSDDDFVLSLLEQNIKRVESQKAKGQDYFAVELLVEKNDDLAGEPTMVDILAAIADLKSAFEKKYTTDGRTSSGLREESEDSEVSEGEESKEGETEKADAPTAQSFALEGLDKLLSMFTELKTKVESGTVTMEDVEASFYGNYELREAIEQAISVMSKMSDCVEALSVITPALQEMEKTAEESKADDSEEAAKDQDEEESKEKAAEDEVEGEKAEEEKADDAKEEPKDEPADDAAEKKSEDDTEELPKEDGEAEETEKSTVDWNGDLAANVMKFDSLEAEYEHFRKANNR